MKTGFLITLLAALLMATAPSSARAVVLDWDSVAWAAGTTSNSYVIGGNTVTISVTGNTSNLISTASPSVATPGLNNDLSGGFTPSQMALRLQADFPNLTNSVTVTISFATAVTNASFSIFDIDVGTGTSTFTYQDQIRNIQASLGAVTSSPILTGGSAVTVAPNTLTGNATAPNTGAGASIGNGDISFVGPLTQITFVYGSGSAVTGGNPAQQGIAISDINFNNISGVPEINTLWVAFAALLLAAGIRTLRQHQARGLFTCSPVE